MARGAVQLLRTFELGTAAIVLGAVFSSCTVKELPTRDAGSHRVAGARQFRVECIHLDQCKEKARAACGSPYEVVSEWHNTIPESELPGLNEETRPKDARDWNHYRLPDRTGIESSEPMPLSSIVVACAS
ncbi:MAG TPA: hypothetical protein VFZ53_33895 [Polyangiaceae bacterium]